MRSGYSHTKWTLDDCFQLFCGLCVLMPSATDSFQFFLGKKSITILCRRTCCRFEIFRFTDFRIFSPEISDHTILKLCHDPNTPPNFNFESDIYIQDHLFWYLGRNSSDGHNIMPKAVRSCSRRTYVLSGFKWVKYRLTDSGHIKFLRLGLHKVDHVAKE